MSSSEGPAGNPQVILTPDARHDLHDAVGWYDAQSPSAGDEFLVEVGVTLRHVTERPTSFPVVYRRMRRAIVDRFQYGVFFVSEPNQVVVLAIVHLSRDPKVWRRRARRSR